MMEQLQVMQVKIKRASMIAAVFLIYMIWGCSAPPSKQSNSEHVMQGSFRHRWWNYYARGLSASENRHHGAAIADLQTALETRDRDRYMARTYGMHFVDYFPHRELGIVYWEIHRLADAEDHLEKSIAQTPTAKAIYYLDRIREERVLRLKKQNPAAIQAPFITLDVPETDFITREDPVVISGVASDPNYVSTLMVGEHSLFLNGTREKVGFRQKLTLPQGVHHIRVSAHGLSGLSHEKTLTIRVDRQGPLIDVYKVIKPNDGPRTQWMVSGSVSDVSGVASLAVNQSAVTIPDGRTVPFRIPLAYNTKTITLTATDQLGNATSTRIDIHHLADLRQPSGTILLASRETPDLTGLFSQHADRLAPTIELKGWTESQTVYMDQVVIEGSVRDDRRIANIFINRSPLNKSGLTGVLTAFNTCIALKKGGNDIFIEAMDADGNRSVKKIHIIRKLPKVKLLNERLSVGILPFVLHGGISTISEAFQDIFMQQVAHRNRFKLVDRLLLDLILQEHKINRTDLIASETALKMGRLTAADAFISGSIIETRMGTEVISRFVDTETAEVLTIVDAYTETKEMDHMRCAAERLSLKLHREFPIVDGDIIDLQAHRIVTSLGEAQLRAQRRILVIEQRPVLHPVTKYPLGHDYQVLGRGHLFQIQPDFSRGRLESGSAPSINTAHRVVTQ